MWGANRLVLGDTCAHPVSTGAGTAGRLPSRVREADRSTLVKLWARAVTDPGGERGPWAPRRGQCGCGRPSLHRAGRGLAQGGCWAVVGTQAEHVRVGRDPSGCQGGSQRSRALARGGASAVFAQVRSQAPSTRAAKVLNVGEGTLAVLQVGPCGVPAGEGTQVLKCTHAFL